MLPQLGADDSVAFQFAVELPAALLPLTLEAQFAGGEGQNDGTPIFAGGHPVQYFTANDPTVSFPVPEPSGFGLAGIASLVLFAHRRLQSAHN